MTVPAPVPVTHHSVSIDGQRLGVTEFGDGNAVLVLCPAFSMSRHKQHPWASALAATGYRVLTVDLVGDGEPNATADRSGGVVGLGRQLLAVLDALGVQRAVLGGTSIGASAAVQAAVTAPERVVGLLLEGPFLQRGTSRTKPLMVAGVWLLHRCAPLLRILGRVARCLPSTRSALLSLLREVAGRDPVVAERFVARMLEGPLVPDSLAVQALPTPALIIALRADLAHPAADATRLHAQMHGSRLIRGGTMAQLRLRPKLLAPAVSDFLLTVFEGEVPWAPDREVPGRRS